MERQRERETERLRKRNMKECAKESLLRMDAWYVNKFPTVEQNENKSTLLCSFD